MGHHIVDLRAVLGPDPVLPITLAEVGGNALVVGLDVRQTENLLPEPKVAVHPTQVQVVGRQVGVERPCGGVAD